MNANQPGREPAGRKIRQAARLLLAVSGALLLVGGILQGGYRDTLQKAVRICLEGVGIG